MSRFFSDKARLILSEIKIVITHTVNNWLNDNIPTFGAALAFYTIFSIAPLAIILVAVSGFIFGEAATTGQLEAYMSQLMGPELAQAIQSFVVNAYQPTSGIIATVVSLGLILFLATTIFTQLKTALNNIWKVAAKPEVSGVKRFIIDRFVALALILIFASLFVLSMMIDVILLSLRSYLDPIMPGGVGIWTTLNTIFSFLVLVMLFAVTFKMLPDVRVRWSDVIIGAVVTALLFLLGVWLISIYMGIATTSTYGAAGSFVVFLIWVYYNAMVFFLGAEFTYIYTMRYGSQVKPARHAEFTRYYADGPDEDAYGG